LVEEVLPLGGEGVKQREQANTGLGCQLVLGKAEDTGEDGEELGQVGEHLVTNQQMGGGQQSYPTTRGAKS